MASISEERFIKLKQFILNFERDFRTKNGRNPSKQDICSDPKVHNYYKFYFKFAPDFKKSTSGEKTKKNSPQNSKISTNLWGNNLNKSKQIQNSGQKLEDIDRFQASGIHVRRLINDLYQQQKKESTYFSIRKRKANLFERSYIVTEEIKAQALIAQNGEESETQIDLKITKTLVQKNDISKESSTDQVAKNIHIQNNETAESLFESILNPTEQPAFCEFDEDFNCFDNLNTFIKDSVIGQIDCEDGFMKTKLNFSPPPSPLLVQDSSVVKDAYDFDDISQDDQIFSTQGQKRGRIYIDDNDDYLSIGNSSKNVISRKRTRKENDLNFEDLNCDHSSSDKRKFFKSEGRNVEEQTVCDFYEFTDEDSGLSGNSENISTNILQTFSTTFNSSSIQVSDDSGSKSALETSPKDSSMVIKPKKKNSAIKTKAISKRVYKDNFQRLNMKKSRFVKGNKSVNMKKYKFQKWAANKRKARGDSNSCFKCGEAGHWASSCSNSTSSAFEQNGSVDSTEMNEKPETDVEVHPINFSSGHIAVPKKLFDDLEDPELEGLVQEGLKVFGFDNFRSNQKATVKRILCGKSTLLISPTGSGKSLCYQLASWCFWKRKQFITLVISPLISLMQDQISNFPSGLLPVTLNSSMSEREKEDAVSALVFGKAQVLFLSPESIVGSSGLNALELETLQRIGFVCIDEAHCLAEWSINFRPSYLHLFKILNLRYGIGNFLALTATATKETQKMICKNLKISSEDDVIGRTWVPENLILSVSKTSNKLNSLIDLLKDGVFRDLKSIIIYCTKRSQTEQLVQQIRTLLQFNLTPKQLDFLAKPYHAGLGAYERQQIQKEFLSGKLRIIVATIAFGMGINKKNIRGVIHYNLPKTFESYLQEIGRAGRDGKPAYCHLLLDIDGADLFSLQSFIYANGIDRPSLRKLIGKIFETCKCRKMREMLLEDETDKSDKMYDFQCPTHPVALPIEVLQMDTDIKSDTIYTLLMALELAAGSKIPKIEVFPPTNSIAHVVNYGEHSHMNEILEQSSVLKIAVIIAKQQMGTMFDLNNYSFSLMKLAKQTGMTVAQVRQELKKLNWKRDVITGKMKRSTLNIRYDTYSYYLKTPGDLSDEQSEGIIDYLSQAINEYEKKEIFKLRLVYSIFSQYAIDVSVKANTKTDTEVVKEFNTELIEKSDGLKSFLNGYFHENFTFDYDSSKLSLPPAFKINNQPIPDIMLQIAKFINIHYDQGINTPRRMARILQGITSPKFPSDIWGSVRDFWRSLPMIDFIDLMQLCSQQLAARYSFKLKANE